jgi:hypothetical protein
MPGDFVSAGVHRQNPACNCGIPQLTVASAPAVDPAGLTGDLAYWRSARLALTLTLSKAEAGARNANGRRHQPAAGRQRPIRAHRDADTQRDVEEAAPAYRVIGMHHLRYVRTQLPA